MSDTMSFSSYRKFTPEVGICCTAQLQCVHIKESKALFSKNNETLRAQRKKLFAFADEIKFQTPQFDCIDSILKVVFPSKIVFHHLYPTISHSGFRKRQSI